MVTHNQKVVAEALNLARKEGFHTGFRFLCKNITPKATTVDLEQVRFKWFALKCVEHGILSKDRVTEAFKELGVASQNATIAIQNFNNAYNQTGE